MIDVSTFVKTLDGKPLAVFGLGLSNLAAIKALVAAGADVAAWDDNEERRIEAARAGAGITDLTAADMSNYGCLVLAPGVPYTHHPHPVVRKAQAAGVEILCDIEILHRCGHGIKTVGITGTNGKSTTTALTGHILAACGMDTVVGGNIGKAALALDLPQGNDAVIVLELSSYQLDLCPSFAPDIAICLNISPDHIDRHGSMDGYIAAKKRIFRGEGKAIIGIDDAPSAALAEAINSADVRRVYDITANDEGMAMVDAPALRGMHNRQNMAAAYQVARLLGVAHEDIVAAIESFPGLPHRQYPVRIIDDVAYVNDSKATNADATARALDSFTQIYWIAGGRAKEGGLSGLEKYAERIDSVYLIGEAAEDFALWCQAQGVTYRMCGSMEQAVQAAHENAQSQSSGTVLLSPACASFDQYKSFEARGDDFTALVQALDKKQATAL